MTDTIRTKAELLTLFEDNAPAKSINAQRLRDFVVSSMLDGRLQHVDIQLTNAQILTLKDTPIQILPAPGAGLGILLVQSVWVADTSGGAYTDPGGLDDEVIIFQYSNNTLAGSFAAWDNFSLHNTGVGIFNGATDAFFSVSIKNLALRLKNYGSSNWGGGNAANTISFRIYYKIVPIIPFGA